jgi:hypothetical protein
VNRAWLIAVSLALIAPACARVPATPAAVPAPRQLAVDYGRLPMTFVANQGQSDDVVRFLARGDGYSVFLTDAEAVLSLRSRPRSNEPDAVVRMRLVGANPHPRVTPLDAQPGTSNYFIGNDPARWQRDLPNYGKVKYSAVYPGIDQIYYGNQRQLEYDLVVAPGADPQRVVLAFDGVQSIAIDRDRNAVLQTPQGEITQRAAVLYQDIDGRRQSVNGGYQLRADNTLAFDIGPYDRNYPLVIDPVVSYSTYLGGSGNDVGQAIAVDGAGNAYVTGETLSTNFPGAPTSPIQPNKQASYDAFVTKLNALGSAVVYSTYLGGSGGDFAYAIAVDSLGNAYVTGETDSPTIAGAGNVRFPIVGGVQPLYRGGGDAFVTKISAAGNALVYSTYLGGSGTERGYGIAVDSAGNAYVAGHTNSVNGPGNFPTVNPFQSQNASLGNYDAFVSKFNADGSALIYSTYLGGNGSEYSLDGGAIAVDADGNAYVGGTTGSTNFPGASGSAIQAANGGGVSDGFIVKFNAAGTGLVYSTYLGGSTYDAVNGLALDAGRDVYVVGYTDSANFKTSAPLQPARNGFGNDAFAARLNAAGSALVYSTYLGGSGSDTAYDVKVDAAGTAHIAGFTSSNNFPTVAAIQPAYRGSGDAFVSQINAGGSALIYSSYLGGSNGSEQAYGIALDAGGDVYVTGETNSTNFPVANPLQAAFGGAGDDAFVVKLVGDAGVLRPPTNLIATSIIGNDHLDAPGEQHRADWLCA